MHTLVHSPASTMRGLPISLTRSITAASSQVFIDVRSSSAWPGKGAVTSSNIGPEKLFSATVVRSVETPKPAAAAATRPALERSCTGSIECVAKAIWDWKSIRIRVWSCGLSNWAPGAALATGRVAGRRGVAGVHMMRVPSDGGEEGAGDRQDRQDRRQAGRDAAAACGRADLKRCRPEPDRR